MRLLDRLPRRRDLANREALRLWVRKTLGGYANSNRPAVRRGYLLARQTGRRVARVVTGRQLGWVAMVRSAGWIGPTTFAFSGWAYERGFGYPDGPPRTRIWFTCGDRRVEVAVDQTVDHEANASVSNAQFDYANTAFTAEVDVAALHAHLPARPGDELVWVARVEVVGPDGSRRHGTFVQRERMGSPRNLTTCTYADGTQVVPAFDGRAQGLTLTSRRPVVTASDVVLSGRRLSATLRSANELAAVKFDTEGVRRPATLRRLPDDGEGFGYALEGAVPTDVPPVEDGTVQLSISRTLVARDVDGRTHVVAAALDAAAPEVFADSTMLVTSGPDGQLTVLDAPARVVVDGWALDAGPEPSLALHGRYVVAPETSDAVPVLSFEGTRQSLPVAAELTPGEGGRGEWRATAPLLVGEWGRAPLPPRQGSYVLSALLPDGQALPVSGTPEISAGTPDVTGFPTFRLTRQSGGGRTVRFRVSPPRRTDELGSFQQRRLERVYLSRRSTPTDAVYLESFYGRGATCNPRAIDAELARTRPDLPRYWGVVDASVAVPGGAVAVVRGTREWWEIRSRARWVVANDWLRRQFEPQHFQVVLQTWHGSMLKRIGFDRPKLAADQRRVIEIERDKWDLLLSQNAHSTDILRSAYAWDGPVLEEGYPRNDPLTPSSTQAGDGGAIRAALGIQPHQTAVLYAPTWRENMTEMVTFLDLERLAAQLGPDHVILLRGHSRTVAFGASVSLGGVIDVTTYPEVADLFLAADVLVTDYSSVMFDYSVTGRPMIFYVPDMDAYRDSLRGVYFDLSEVAPGPVLSDQDDVAEAILALAGAGERYADAYARWQERFNHADDGRSAQRVTAALLGFEK